MANGTAALHLALLALEVGPGDEVIQPALNFVAAANMTAAVGASPVLADVMWLDEPTLEPKEWNVAHAADPKAVVVMHYGGIPCRMAEIVAMCREQKIALIEDACHAVGARYHDEAVRFPTSPWPGRSATWDASPSSATRTSPQARAGW